VDFAVKFFCTHIEALAMLSPARRRKYSVAKRPNKAESCKIHILT